MGNTIFAQAAQFLYDRRGKRRWQIAVCCLAALVIFGTTWALIRQGKALMGSQESVLDCKYEVHKHSEECYEDGKLVCGKVEYVVHTHEDNCYDEDGELVCLLPEIEGHVHDAGCFVIEESLVCGFVESASGSNVEEPSNDQGGSVDGYTQEAELICGLEEHSHTDGCYEVNVSEERTLTCGQEEQVGHSHTDDCYEVVTSEKRILTCEEDEQAGHIHTDDCYEVETSEESVLTCGQEELTGHTHTDDCYEVETSEESILTCEQEEHTHSTDCYGDADSVQNDVAADDAIEHTHSDDCYQMVRRLICGEEGVHVHDDDCYQDGTLICTAPEVESLEEHVHDSECFKTVEGEEYTQIFMNSDIKVTVAYRASSGIPEDVRMDVEQITNGEHYENRLAELEGMDSAVEDDEELVMLLGFGFEKLDERFVPKDTVSLTVQFLNDSIYAVGDEVTVACFGEGGVNLISGMYVDADGSITFDVDDLSELAFIAPTEKLGARVLVYEGEDYIVSVGLGEDSAVPEDAELAVEKINLEDSKSYEEYFEKLDNADVLEDNEILAILLDMKIYAQDQEIVPDETMKVMVQFLNREVYFEGDAVKVAHITTNGIELLEASDMDSNISTTFTVDELAGIAFIIDSDIRTMTAEGEDYVVTVRFDSKAMIPEDAKFVAVRITPESDPELFEAREKQARAEIDDELFIAEALFDIGFYGADGEEIEPQSTVDIKIQLLDRNGAEISDSFKVIHFAVDEESAEENIEVIEDADVTNDEDGNISTSFQLDSFSDILLLTPYSGTTVLMGNSPDGIKDGKALSDAIKAAKSGDTIVLEGDFEFTGSAIEISGKTITLDMNGHTIHVTANTVLFSIGSKGKLNITDTNTKDRDFRKTEGGKGKATYDKWSGKKLATMTCDVTESVVIDPLNGRTEETTYTYEVTGHGAIVGYEKASVALIALTSGKNAELSISGGVIIAGGNQRAIFDTQGSTINLSDCYLVGNGSRAFEVTDNSTKTENGGAIYTTGTLNIDEGTIISGNDAPRGGGIFALNGATVNLKGGYITNNTATLEKMLKGSEYNEKDIGGGGGLLISKATLNMSGGYVTGNIAYLGGAGITLDCKYYNTANSQDQKDLLTQANISAGHISSNHSIGKRGEGAGIGAYGYNSNTATILSIKVTNDSDRVYITNNELISTSDWGGGGVFISAHARGYLYSTLITDNTALGFGGGLAGCSTGQIVNVDGKDYRESVSVYGAAIFDNVAYGVKEARSGTVAPDGKRKNQDTLYTESDDYKELFWRTGPDDKYLFQDCFAAYKMDLYNVMLGGGNENWVGTQDKTEITGKEENLDKEYFISSDLLLGLTAYPDPEHEVKAMESARVFITGNYSNIHGGGIMCNGILSLGEKPSEIERSSELVLTAQKLLIDETVNKEVGMEADKFSFAIYEDANCSKLISTGKNDADGTITFGVLSFNLSRDYNKHYDLGGKETYKYYIKEVVSGDISNVGIKWDETIYRLEVDVEKKAASNVQDDGRIPVYKDFIIEIRLYEGKNSKEFIKRYTTSSGSYDKKDKLNGYQFGTQEIKLTNPNRSKNKSALFINNNPKTVDIEVEKTWDLSITDAERSEIEYVVVGLYRYKIGTDKSTATKVTGDNATRNLTAKDGWKAKWTNLTGGYSYYVKEEKIHFTDGSEIQADYLYTPKYEPENDGTKGKIKITNVPKRFGIEITKMNGNASLLSGVAFQVLKDGSPVRFEYTSSGSAEAGVYTVADSSISVEKTTDTLFIVSNPETDGKLKISGLGEGEYTIIETKAPDGYSEISPHTIIFTVSTGENGKPSYTITCDNANCSEHRFTNFNSGDDDSEAVLYLDIIDQEYRYELPETGGIGYAYTGILVVMLFFGIAVVMYTVYQRRKRV